MWRKSIDWSSVDVKYISNRVMMCTFHYNNRCLNIVNVYCPCAGTSNECIVEYLDTLGDISNSIIGIDADLIIMGDFNASKENKFIEYVSAFCNDENLCLYDGLTLTASSTYTFEDLSRGTRSWLDHVIVNYNLKNKVTNCGVLHDFVSSDHFPIFVEVVCDTLKVVNNVATYNADSKYTRGFDWQNMDDNMKCMCIGMLNERLSNLVSPLQEGSFSQSDDNQCVEKVKEYYTSFVAVLKEVCVACVPQRQSYCGNKYNGKSVKGWNEHLAQLHDDARMLYREWRGLGSPRVGNVFDDMCESRRVFKSKLRQMRRNNLTSKANVTALRLANNDSKGFWREVNKLNNCSKGKESEQINGVRGGVDIARLWKNKYERVYNMQRKLDKHNIFLCGLREANDFLVHDEMVLNGINLLKCKKDAGEEGIPVELLRMLPPVGISRLKDLFNMCIMCGFVPEDLVSGTLIPIVKDKKGDLCNADNYRCICIVGSLSKLFDAILLTHLRNRIEISDVQFGFRESCSTDLCCDIFKKIVHKFRTEGSYVFACFIDLKKAFDTVNYWRLFDMLLDRGISRSVVRVLCSMYCNQRMRVRWDGVLSDSFACGNGLRQGSSLSPFLFSVYIDGLLREMSNTSLGCKVAGRIWNCLAYADDIVLFAPSWRGLQVLMDKLLVLIECIDMEINCCKTKCMIFAPVYARFRFLNDIPMFMLGRAQIAFCDSFRYLGHCICNTLDDKDDVNREIRLLFYRTNRLLNRFAMCSVDVKKVLWVSFVNCLYGVGIWKISDNTLQLFVRSYNMCLKKFFGYQKFDQNRYVLFELGLVSPVTLAINARHRAEQAFIKFSEKNVSLLVL
jgi:hypothetical protein